MNNRPALKEPDTLQETFKKVCEGQIIEDFEPPYVQTDDEKFLTNLVEYIRQNISNPDLSVETLSGELRMSRVWLYKKLLMLTGKSPIEFIRAIRLQKGVLLLDNTQMKISRIASEVGFETPQYFSKLFKKEHGILPSDYVRYVRKNKARLMLDAYGLDAAINIADFNSDNVIDQSQNLI